MNREIKFRAWDSIHSKMIYLEDVVLFGHSNEFDIYELYFEENNLRCRGYDDFDDEFGGQIVNETELPVMQYTGLKDKNGVEIYENDIIDIHQTVNGYNQFVIQYDNYKFNARYYNQKTKQVLGWYQYDLDELFEINEFEKEIEVIGNICENEVDENEI